MLEARQIGVRTRPGRSFDHPCITHPHTVKSVIVTGASRGIGRAIATRLGHDGFAVVVNFAGNSSKAEEVVAEIKAAGGQAIAVQADVASTADVERLFKEAVDAFGGINVVVNCAGIMHYSPIDRLHLDLFDKMINTNLRGTFIVLGQASRQLSPGGSIIAFSSWCYRHGVTYLRPLYCFQSRR